MTINTAFVKIYGELLEPYGYRKIKGRMPYFVRVVGDEIVHVISCITRPMSREGYKEYLIIGGVATVYRYRINLEETPINNGCWLKSSLEFYDITDPFGEKPNRFDELYTFSYKAGDEESLKASVRQSFESTEGIMLPVLNQVTDLKTCMDFFTIYMPSLLFLYREENFEGKYHEDNEGLLNVKMYSVGEFIEKKDRQWREYIEETIHLIKMGKTGYTMETFRQQLPEEEKDNLKFIERFKSYANDKDRFNRAMQELERRKKANIEILRSYGLDV